MSKIKYSEMIKNKTINDFSDYCIICGNKLHNKELVYCYQCKDSHEAEGLLYKS